MRLDEEKTATKLYPEATAAPSGGRLSWAVIPSALRSGDRRYGGMNDACV